MRIPRTLKNLLTALALGVALMGVSLNALADKLYLKDGRVLDGTIVKEDSGFIVFNVNGKEEIFDAADVSRVEKTEPAKPAAPAAAAPAADKPAADKPATDAPSETAKPASTAPNNLPKNRTLTGKPNRIAILNFGPPGNWNEKAGDMVGVVVSAKAWEDAMPLLDKDKVDTVVVRIRSGGGYGLEVARFSEIFRKYKAKYRLVAWVESAISAAAMSPWNISEFYMMPEGNIGACTGWSGRLVATKGVQLMQMLNQMEELSVEGGRDPKIMRSMQIMEPLSYNIDEATGKVTYFQDATSGKHLLNRPGQILCLNAIQAIECKFAVAIAATPDELAQAMGMKEYEWAGQDAAKYIDEFMLTAHKIDKQVGELAVQYRLALSAAQQLANAGDPRFPTELGKAKQYLAQIRRWVEVNPNFRFHLAQGFGAELSDEWFQQQEDILRALAQRAREAEEQRRKR